MSVIDMNGSTITAGATGAVHDDSAYFVARIVDPEPEGQPGYVLADLTDAVGGTVFYRAVLVPAAKVRLDVPS